ncbi:restriction endonuclease [Candidatus Poriferisodalis sp.]|uniref:restriction endonuclease n=1 Tax=Candidatus Poriferisodalis sp. TaxID=3101277 RepID=UPI003B58C9F8
MSFLDAAERVLELDADRQPMALADIVELALKRGYIETRGKTPAATLSAQIGGENRRRKARGEVPRFTKPKHGHYGLTIWQGEGIARAVAQHRHEIAEELKEQLRQLTPDEFEAFVADLLATIGVEELEVVGQPGDKGIDVRGILVVAGVIRRSIAVQAKRWTTNNVGRPAVQQLRGGLGSHDIGLLVTVGAFANTAREEAERRDAAPVALLDGDGISELMLEHEIGVTRTRLEIFEIADVSSVEVDARRGRSHE